MPPRDDATRIIEVRKQAHRDFLEVLGADIAQMRKDAGITQPQIGETLGFSTRWISKAERGENNLTVYDFLNIIALLQEADPDHPAVGLLARYMPKKRRRVK